MDIVLCLCCGTLQSPDVPMAGTCEVCGEEMPLCIPVEQGHSHLVLAYIREMRRLTLPTRAAFATMLAERAPKYMRRLPVKSAADAMARYDVGFSEMLAARMMLLLQERAHEVSANEAETETETLAECLAETQSDWKKGEN